MTIVADDSLLHYGVGGMKWGLRRYQNPDGSLTEEGRIRYGKSKRARAKLYTMQLRDNTNMQRSFMENKEVLEKSLDKLNKKKDSLSENNKESSVKRVDKKIDKAKTGIVLNDMMIESSKKRVEQIISDATMNHYKVTAKDVTRGKNILNKMFDISPTTVTEYKVKKTKYSSI